LTIVGASTVTTSAFVFLDRYGRKNNQIPWVLAWLAPVNCRRQCRIGYALTQSMEIQVCLPDLSEADCR
jgi:hypothetical protein